MKLYCLFILIQCFNMLSGQIIKQEGNMDVELEISSEVCGEDFLPIKDFTEDGIEEGIEAALKNSALCMEKCKCSNHYEYRYISPPNIFYCSSISYSLYL